MICLSSTNGRHHVTKTFATLHYTSLHFTTLHYTSLHLTPLHYTCSTLLQNKVLRRIFGPKRDEITKEWRKIHNEERNVLYCSPIIVRMIKSRRMRWTGHVACMGERRDVYRVLVGKPEGKETTGETQT